MSEREFWEIVRADQLKVGDVVKIGFHHPADAVAVIEGGWIRTNQYGISYETMVLRRIPDADDPRVLRRALEIAIDSANYDLGDAALPTYADRIIDQARHELESEGKDDQA